MCASIFHERAILTRPECSGSACILVLFEVFLRPTAQMHRGPGCSAISNIILKKYFKSDKDYVVGGSHTRYTTRLAMLRSTRDAGTPLILRILINRAHLGGGLRGSHPVLKLGKARVPGYIKRCEFILDFSIWDHHTTTRPTTSTPGQNSACA